MTPVCRHPEVSALPVEVPPRRSSLTHARRFRRLLEFCRSSGPVASAIVAVLLLSGPVSPVGSEDRIRVPQDDAAALAEIARDVINRASTGPDRALSESSSQVGVADESTVAGSAPDPAPSLSHHPPGGKGISVSAPATASPPKRAPATSGAAGYQSNSWRQAPAESARSLSFSSGFFTPSPGLDPALKAQADRVRVEGRPFVYGFLLLRVPLDGPLQNSLASLGVRLLGPHDDHQKVRVPVGSLEAVASAGRGRVARGEPAGAEAEPRAGRRSRRSDQRDRGRGRGRDDPDRHQSVRGGWKRELPPATRSRRGHGRGVRPRAPLLSRGGHAGRPSTGSSPSTSCCSSS